jgi:hypothetical protein
LVNSYSDNLNIFFCPECSSATSPGLAELNWVKCRGVVRCSEVAVCQSSDVTRRDENLSEKLQIEVIPLKKVKKVGPNRVARFF